jgi:hypothetical protein
MSARGLFAPSPTKPEPADHQGSAQPKYSEELSTSNFENGEYFCEQLKNGTQNLHMTIGFTGSPNGCGVHSVFLNTMQGGWH